MNRVRLAIGAVPLVVGLVVAVPADVAASHLGPGIPDATAVTVSFVPAAQSQAPDRIAARLVAFDGRPIGNEQIEFRRSIEFLGSRLVLLGRGTTDAGGVAQISIRPTDRDLRIDVRFPGDDHYLPSETTVEVLVPEGSVRTPGTSLFEPPRPGVGLGQLASLMPLVIAGATFGVWVVLIALVLLTFRGIGRGHQHPARGDPKQEGTS